MKTEIRERDWKDKAKQDPPPNKEKSKIIDENKPFTSNILMLTRNKSKETRQEKNKKNKEGHKKKTARKETNKKLEKERERESEKEKCMKPRRKKGRHREINKNNPFAAGKKSVFVKRPKKEKKV